jgi:heptosyltransferase-1
MARRPHILIVRLSALGDVIRALPVLATLRARLPDAEVAWLVEDRAATLLRGHVHIDRLVEFPRRRWQAALLRPWRWPGALREMVGLVLTLRRPRLDVSIDLQGNLKSGILVGLAGAARRLGFARGTGREANFLFQNERVVVGPDVHKMDRGLKLLEPLLGPAPAETRVVVPSSAEESAAVDAFLDEAGLTPGEFVVLHPGTSAFAAYKRWPPRRFGELARWLRERTGRPSLVTWTPGEEALLRDVLAASDGAARASPIWGRLGELTALLGRAGLVVGADTGPPHLAAAMGTPTVVLFGQKDPRLYAPYGPRVEVVWNRVSCSPCNLRFCPDPICMSTMRTEEVREAVERCLGPEPFNHPSEI